MIQLAASMEGRLRQPLEFVRVKIGVPKAAFLAVCGRLMIGVLRAIMGVIGESISMGIPFFSFFFVLSTARFTSPSSSTISGSPESIPASVLNKSSRSFLNRRSFCSRRLISMKRASSSAIWSGVRCSKLTMYFLRVNSRSMVQDLIK